MWLELTNWSLEAFKNISRWRIVQLILVIDGWGISFEIVLLWMLLYLTDDKSTSVQVMAWSHQATSHYLNHYWFRSMPPCGLTRPQWVKPVDGWITPGSTTYAGTMMTMYSPLIYRTMYQLISPGQNGRHFADDIFRCIFVNGIFCILIKISLKFVHKGPIDNNPALV